VKQELLKGGTDELVISIKDHGRTVTPSTCTCRILDRGTLLESGAATGGRYRPGSGTVALVHQGLTAEWTFIVDAGAEQKHVMLFDVVLFKLSPMVTDEDLVSEAPVLAGADYIFHGTVETLTASGFIDRALIGAREDWRGAILSIISGTDASGQYLVTDFDSATGTLTYTYTTPTAIDAVFTLRRSYAGEIAAAWSDIMDKLEQACDAALDGDRSTLVMTPDRLKRPHSLRALEKVFRGLADDANGIEWAKAEFYSKEFEASWNGLRLVFADDDASEPVQEHEGSAQWGFSR
jgi:hypothetical protein